MCFCVCVAIPRLCAQMQLTGSLLEEGMNWRTSERSPGRNTAVRAYVVLRGREAAAALRDAITTINIPEL